VNLAPLRFSSATAIRCVKLPRPELPTRTLPGLALAWAMNARMSFHGASVLTARDTGSVVSCATPANAVWSNFMLPAWYAVLMLLEFHTSA
jgi:hypothetical protein